VRAVEVTEGIYPVGTQREPDIPGLIPKLRELSVETLTLLAIGGISQLAIILLTFS
jgi:hypothetical protein